MGTDQPRRYKLGEGIFTTKVNFDGRRLCRLCDQPLWWYQRIDTQDEHNFHRSYCFDCYRRAISNAGGERV